MNNAATPAPDNVAPSKLPEPGELVLSYLQCTDSHIPSSIIIQMSSKFLETYGFGSIDIQKKEKKPCMTQQKSNQDFSPRYALPNQDALFESVAK